MKNAFALTSTALLLLAQGCRGGVTFSLDFEAGSKWYTEPWSEAARNELGTFLTELGNLFDSDATVRVMVTDDAAGGAFASASFSWSTRTTVEGRDGVFFAPSLWSIIVKGVDDNGAGEDAVINWDLNVDTRYGGDSGRLIGNIRGLARHEMHHAFGCSSGLRQNNSFDPRGTATSASLMDSLWRDVNDQPLLGAYNAATQSFTVNNYTLLPDWFTVRNQSGLYLEARNIRGEVVKMPPSSGTTLNQDHLIDFTHVTGIAYPAPGSPGDHPSWSNIEETDRNFLRTLGYPLVEDAELKEGATVVDFGITGAGAEITCGTRSDRHYRVKTSKDLVHWFLRPKGQRGTDGDLKLTVPAEASEVKKFFQVIEIPE